MATIREASFADYGQIEALKARHHLSGYTEARWRHIYENSPLLNRRRLSWPIGWVIETGDKKIVGHLGNTPLEYEFNHKPLVGAAASLWVVDEEHRNQSLALVGKFFGQPGVDLFLNTTAVQLAGRVFEKLGMKRPPVPAYDRTVFWVLDHGRFLSSLLAKKRIASPRLLTRPLAALMVAAESVAGKGRLVSAAGGPVEFCACFDGRFDRFWEGLRSQCGRLLCVRDRKNLDWRFQEALASGAAWVLAAGDPTNLRAYAVCLRQDSPDIGLKRMRLADFQCAEGHLDALAAILSAALARCRSEGIHMLEVVGFGAEKKARLEALAPYRRQLPGWMFLYKAPDACLARELENPSVWDSCTYDGDGWLAQIKL
ncbi:MAG: hypothetical protein NTY01_19610 [Verrucomicrobia bacterium]|nr:hypothetical protein [Verrucomicrobiota bacterium]